MANIFNLLGPIMAGIGAVGVLLFLRRVLKVPMPGWIIPIGAAVTMMGTHMLNEYTWFSRFSAELPETMVIIDTAAEASWFEPWTYILPKTSRFAAIDLSSIKTNETNSDLVMGEVLLFQRYTPTAHVREIADCANNRTMGVQPGSKLDESGMPVNQHWVDRDETHPILKAMCKGNG